MLSIMRRKAGSWMIKIILGAIVVVFIFWGVGSFTDQSDGRVATVNGQTISYDEYNQIYNRLIENLNRQFGNGLNDELIKMMNVKQQALDQAIDKKLLLEEAARLSIRVSDEELAENILKYPAFQGEGGTFDSRQYEQALAQNRLTVKGFETLQREQLLLGKLQSLLAAGAQTNEAEARAWYEWDKSQVKVTYVLFDPAQGPEPAATDEEIAAYYDTNKERYKSEPMRKVRYVSFTAEEHAAGITVTDNDVTDYYEANPERFETPKTVEARHVLFRLPQNADPATVEAAFTKAEDVRKKASSGVDFAELAKTHTEDPTGKTNGGFLGAFKKQDMVAAFADKAFSMSPGQISEPVRTPFGWHVIKVEKVNEGGITPLDRAAPEIRARLIQEQALSAAYDAAEAVYNAALNRPDLAKAAETAKKKIQETDFFTRTGPVDVAEKEPFASVAFELAENEISEVVETEKVYYVMQLLEEKPSRTPELNEIKEMARKDLLVQKRDEKARADAAAFLLTVQSDPSLLPAKAGQAGKKPVTTDFFGRNASIANLGTEREVNRAAFELSLKAPLAASPLKTQKGYCVMRLDERKGPDPAGFAQQKDGIVERLTQQKQARAFDALVAHLRETGSISYEKGFLD